MTRLAARALSTLFAAALLSACGPPKDPCFDSVENEETDADCGGAECEGVTCQNGGVPTSTNGTCACACTGGYEGASCETAKNAAFVGDYLVVETCSRSESAEYEATITADSANPAGVKIGNFWNMYTQPVVATADAEGKLQVAEQDPDGDGFFVSGSATRDGAKLTFSYTVEDRIDPSSVVSDQCTGTWTRLD